MIQKADSESLMHERWPDELKTEEKGIKLAKLFRHQRIKYDSAWWGIETGRDKAECRARIFSIRFRMLCFVR